MDIRASQVLTEIYGKGNVSDSYLHIGNHALMDDDGKFPDSLDERKGWSLDVQQLLRLHGYTADFNWAGRAAFGGIAEPGIPHYENPSPTDDAWVDVGTKMFPIFGVDNSPSTLILLAFSDWSQAIV